MAKRNYLQFKIVIFAFKNRQKIVNALKRQGISPKSERGYPDCVLCHFGIISCRSQVRKDLFVDLQTFMVKFPHLLLIL